MKKTKKIIDSTLGKLKNYKKNTYSIAPKDLLKRRTCPICNHNKCEVIGKVLIEKKNISILETSICKFCGHIFRSVMPKNKWFSKCWNKIKESRPSVVNRDLEKLRQRRYEYYYKHYISEIDQNTEKKINLLDIGAAFGSGSIFLRKKNIAVECLEPELNRLNFLKRKKFKVYSSFIENSSIKKKYDFIIFAHALEHCEDIYKAIKKIKNLMHKKTLLYIEVPNSEKVIDFYDLLYTPHRNNFNSNNLKYFLANNNFDILNFENKLFKDEGPVLCILVSLNLNKKKNLKLKKINKNSILKKKKLYNYKKIIFKNVFVDKITNFFYLVNINLGSFIKNKKYITFRHND